MTDRELWASVFNTALASCVKAKEGVMINGKPADAYSWSKAIADQALKDAPEDHP